MMVDKLLASLPENPSLLAVPVNSHSQRDQVLQELTRKSEDLQHIVWDFRIHPSPILKEQLAAFLEEVEEDFWVNSSSAMLHLINMESAFFKEITEDQPSLWEQQSEGWPNFLSILPCTVCLWAYHESIRTLSQAPKAIADAIILIEEASPFSLAEDEGYIKAEKDIEASEAKEEVALKQHEAGILCSQAREWQRSLIHYVQSSALWEELEDPQVCRAYNNIASVYHLFGDLETAASYYEKTLEIEITVNNQVSHARAEAQMGHLLSETDSEEAMNHYSEAIKLFEEVAEEELQAEDYLELANIQIYISEFDEAINYLRTATSKFTADDNKQGLITSLQKLASIYEYKGRLALATKCFKNIAILMENINEEEGEMRYGHETLANAFQQVASLELKQKNLDPEIEALEKALSYAEEVDSPFLLASVEDSLSSAKKKKEKGSSFFGSMFSKKS
ncbi:MAG: tetratricopeptide repeat protein [Bacteroidota bacterium]